MALFRSALRPRVGLVGKFALASLVPIVLLGLVLAHVLRTDIRQRALVNTKQSAALLEKSLIEPQLSAADLNGPLSRGRVRTLDKLLRPSLKSHAIARIKIWTRHGRAVYATNHHIIGKKFVPSDELREALGGETASEISDLRAAENAGDRSFGQLLEVYTPLRFSEGGPVVGAFELYLPYRPVQAAINQETTRLSVILLAGLALLYLVLYRIVARASKRLRRQAADLRRQAAENKHLALHDPLTDLPNRSLFHDRAALGADPRNRGRVRADPVEPRDRPATQAKGDKTRAAMG